MTPYRPTTLCAAVIVLGALGLPAPSRAQSIPSPYRYIETSQEGGAFVGAVDPGTGRFDLGPGPGTLLGVRYAVEIGGPFSVEGVLRSLSTTRSVINPRNLEGQRKVGEADARITSLDARIKFSLPGRRTWHGLGPYVLLGGGVAIDLEGTQEIDRELEEPDRFEFGTSFLGVLGGGIRWLPSDRFVVRTDGLLNLWQLDTPQGFRDPALEFEGVPDSEWVNGLSWSVGVAFRW